MNADEYRALPCIRMLNEDVIDLYQRTPVGTRVLVLKHLSPERRSV